MQKNLTQAAIAESSSSGHLWAGQAYHGVISEDRRVKQRPAVTSCKRAAAAICPAQPASGDTIYVMYAYG